MVAELTKCIRTNLDCADAAAIGNDEGGNWIGRERQSLRGFV